MTLSTKLKKEGKSKRKPKPKRKKPLWGGPETDGVTQSMLSRFLVCRERFRLLVVEGLRPVDTFNHRVEYGQMWHSCEEGFACEVASREGGAIDCAFSNLGGYARKLCKKYPLQQEQIQHWYNVCKVQFPIYVEHWAKQKSRKQRTSLMQEEVFDVPYKLSSGRVVRLRGKWDGVSLEGKGRNAGIWLDEHKTKGDISEEQMKRQLQFDLQTMIYLIALQEQLEHWDETPGAWKPTHKIQGVNYNVVRRPLSGGKYSIRQHKPTKAKPGGESLAEFYARVAQIIRDDPEWFFMRWKVIITQDDIKRFKREFLNPILEQLCDWYSWMTRGADPFKPWVDPNEPSHMEYVHWRTPYGFYNILAEGGSSELDEFLATGSELGLTRTDKLFRELE